MQHNVSLFDASNSLFDIIFNNIEQDMNVTASVCNQVVTIHTTDRSNAIISVHNPDFSEYLLGIGKSRGPLDTLTFSADYMRSIINSFQDIGQYFERDFMLLEAYMNDYLNLERGYDPTFTAYFQLEYEERTDIYRFRLYRKLDDDELASVKASLPTGTPLHNFAQQDMNYYLTAASFSRLQEIFGTEIIEYYDGLFTDKLRLRKLKLLAQ